MTTIFQTCTPCNKNRAHYWVSSLVYKCISCGKETKLSKSVTIDTTWPVEEAPVKKHTPQTHLGLIRTINKAHRDHVSGLQ